jgi:hypothetical protein
MLSKGRVEYGRVEQWQRKALSGVGEVLCGGALAEWCHVAQWRGVVQLCDGKVECSKGNVPLRRVRAV